MPRLPDESIDMILCDLPYGTTRNSWDSLLPIESLWQEYERLIKPEGAIVLTAQIPFTISLASSRLDLLRYEWIWQKESGSGFLNANRAPLKSHENILVFSKKQTKYNPVMRDGFSKYKTTQGNAGSNYGESESVTTISDGRRFPLDVIEFPRDREKIHPTQKPVALFEYLIKTYTDKGDVVLDNCIGSGTTAIACLNTERKFIGFELNKDYFDMAETRVRNNTTQLDLFG